MPRTSGPLDGKKFLPCITYQTLFGGRPVHYHLEGIDISSEHVPDGLGEWREIEDCENLDCRGLITNCHCGFVYKLDAIENYIKKENPNLLKECDGKLPSRFENCNNCSNTCSRCHQKKKLEKEKLHVYKGLEKKLCPAHAKMGDPAKHFAESQDDLNKAEVIFHHLWQHPDQLALVRGQGGYNAFILYQQQANEAATQGHSKPDIKTFVMTYLENQHKKLSLPLNDGSPDKNQRPSATPLQTAHPSHDQGPNQSSQINNTDPWFQGSVQALPLQEVTSFYEWFGSQLAALSSSQDIDSTSDGNQSTHLPEQSQNHLPIQSSFDNRATSAPPPTIPMPMEPPSLPRYPSDPAEQINPYYQYPNANSNWQITPFTHQMPQQAAMTPAGGLPMHSSFNNYRGFHSNALGHGQVLHPALPTAQSANSGFQWDNPPRSRITNEGPSPSHNFSQWVERKISGDLSEYIYDDSGDEVEFTAYRRTFDPCSNVASSGTMRPLPLIPSTSTKNTSKSSDIPVTAHDNLVSLPTPPGTVEKSHGPPIIEGLLHDFEVLAGIQRLAGSFMSKYPEWQRNVYKTLHSANPDSRGQLPDHIEVSDVQKILQLLPKTLYKGSFDTIPTAYDYDINVACIKLLANHVPALPKKNDPYNTPLPRQRSRRHYFDTITLHFGQFSIERDRQLIDPEIVHLRWVHECMSWMVCEVIEGEGHPTRILNLLEAQVDLLLDLKDSQGSRMVHRARIDCAHQGCPLHCDYTRIFTGVIAIVVITAERACLQAYRSKAWEELDKRRKVFYKSMKVAAKLMDCNSVNFHRLLEQLDDPYLPQEERENMIIKCKIYDGIIEKIDRLYLTFVDYGVMQKEHDGIEKNFSLLVESTLDGQQDMRKEIWNEFNEYIDDPQRPIIPCYEFFTIPKEEFPTNPLLRKWEQYVGADYLEDETIQVQEVFENDSDVQLRGGAKRLRGD